MKKIFTLFAVAAMAFAAQANVLSVCQGEYQSSITPVYGLWYDTPGMTQQIYPADMLAEMAGGDITEISFLTLANVDGTPYGQDFSSYTLHFEGGEVTLALMEVEPLGFEQTAAMTGATVVATATPTYGELALTFVLDEPFHYNGGNLLVEVTVTEPGEYGSTYFWGMGMVDENDEALYYPTYYYNENYSGGVNAEGLSLFLAAADFSYNAGQAPVEPTEKTDAPSSTKENYVYNDGNMYYNAYTVTLTETEESTIYYRIGIMNEEGQYEYGEWMEYEDAMQFVVPGTYMVEAYAVAPGKLESDHIFDGFVVSRLTDVEELMAGKQVANVRYFNLAGQEMQQASGLTIMVTTYTDGTTSAVKVVK